MPDVGEPHDLVTERPTGRADLALQVLYQPIVDLRRQVVARTVVSVSVASQQQHRQR